MSSALMRRPPSAPERSRRRFRTWPGPRTASSARSAGCSRSTCPSTRRPISRCCSRRTSATTRCRPRDPSCGATSLPSRSARWSCSSLVQLPLAWSLRHPSSRPPTGAGGATATRTRRIGGRAPPDRAQTCTTGSCRTSPASPIRSPQPPAPRTSTPIGRRCSRARPRRCGRGIKALRSLLVELYPPNLEEEGLESAVADLLAGAAARGLGHRSRHRPGWSTPYRPPPTRCSTGPLKRRSATWFVTPTLAACE